MFRFKRNFSIRESSSRLSSASPSKLESSPNKRIRLSSTRLSNCLFQNDEKSTLLQQSFTISSSVSEAKEKTLFAGKLETPPPTPIAPLAPITPSTTIEKIESKIENLKQKNSELRGEMMDLDRQIEAKFQSIKTKREQVAEARTKRFVVEDYIAISFKGQLVIRDLLNVIYNPGNQLANKASTIFEEAKRNHAKKFEKMVFELGNLMETSQAAAQQKVKQLTHDIALHERTLMTIECDKRQELSQTVESDPSTNKVVEENLENDDDCCVILDSEGVENEVEVREEEEDDEKTDISSQNNDEEERSFTPCQAQRPE